MGQNRAAAVADSREDRRRSQIIAAAVIAGIALAGVSAAVTFDSTASAAAAVARGLMVAAPVCAGAYAWQRRPFGRFGRLLVLTGYLWFLTTLAESDHQTAYSIGRVAGWLAEVSLIYLVLSFPTGRLTGRVDRALVWAGAAIVGLLYLPSALLIEAYPTPSVVSSCVADCPDNALMLAATEPAWIDAAVRPLREALTLLLFGAVLARLASRVRGATPLLRMTLNPVLVVAIARLAVLLGALATRALDPSGPEAELLSWLAALALPAMALSFAVGLIRQRMLVGDAVTRLSTLMQSGLTSGELESALARALHDPALRLVLCDPAEPGAWTDSEGRPVGRPQPEPGRMVVEVVQGDRVLALMVLDEAVAHQPELLSAALSLSRVALMNERLSAEVKSALLEIEESRSRLQAAADEERRRIERDLHDGAQQRLVALRIKLELAGELLQTDPAKGLAKLHLLGDEVTETLDDIRSIARGPYPALLAEQGLPDALEAAAQHAQADTHVAPDGVGRYPKQIESAVYYCCVEAMQNVAKHAPGAHRVDVRLHEDDRLHFEVSDDGEGFDVGSSGGGAGLANMRDRLEAVGGRLVVRSVPGHGSVVTGSVPRS